jgi:hypothetical protein
MDTPTTADERLAGPEWVAFIEGLALALADWMAGDVSEAEFWREVDIAQGPLYEGVTEEDGAVIEAAVAAELAARGLHRES